MIHEGPFPHNVCRVVSVLKASCKKRPERLDWWAFPCFTRARRAWTKVNLLEARVKTLPTLSSLSVPSGLSSLDWYCCRRPGERLSPVVRSNSRSGLPPCYTQKFAGIISPYRRFPSQQRQGKPSPRESARIRYLQTFSRDS